jgi:hypothetical protein
VSGVGCREADKRFMTSNEFYEFESLTINVPKSMPLSNKLAEVSRQISEWLESIEEPLNDKTLRLKKIDETDKDYVYWYEIQRKPNEKRVPH